LSDFKSVPRDRLDLQPESSADNRQSKEALPATKSGAKPGTIYGTGSATDLSVGRDSSNSKAHGTMKRQWKAPADNVREASQFEGI
jgi:hypothetical protein